MADGSAATDGAKPNVMPTVVPRDQAALVAAANGPMPAQAGVSRPSTPSPILLHPAGSAAPDTVMRPTPRPDAPGVPPALPATPPDPSMRPVMRPEMPASPREPRVAQAVVPPNPHTAAASPTRPGSLSHVTGPLPLAAPQISPARAAREEGSIRVTSATPDGPLRSGIRPATTAGSPQLTRLPLAAPVSPLANAPYTDPTRTVVEAADLGMGQTLPLHGPATAALTPLSTNAPALLAQGAAHQVAAAMSDPARDTSAPLELALDPPELGRVRLQITELAGIMTLTIHAERPETAELMRRHLDLLAQEFAQAGLDAPQVRISHDGPNGGPDGGNAQAGDREAGAQPAASAASEAQTSPQPSRTASGGLDIRL